jgi:hypothetical protein
LKIFGKKTLSEIVPTEECIILKDIHEKQNLEQKTRNDIKVQEPD